MNSDPWPLIQSECERQGHVTITKGVAKQISDQIDGKALRNAELEIARLKHLLASEYSKAFRLRRIISYYIGENHG